MRDGWVEELRGGREGSGGRKASRKSQSCRGCGIGYYIVLMVRVLHARGGSKRGVAISGSQYLKFIFGETP